MCNCASYSFYICFSQSKSILVRNYLTQLFRWPHYLIMTPKLVQFFFSRTYLWHARQCFPCRWDRQNKDWEVGFFRQHFPSKAHRPTTNEHHETTNRRLQSSTFCVVARKLHTWSCMEVLLTSRCHPKNLLLFWRRCVLPYDLNIPLKNSFRINRRVARAQEMWTEERYLVGPICWNGVDKENIARMECFCSTIICHCC